jgi:hypothetical protein
MATCQAQIVTSFSIPEPTRGQPARAEKGCAPAALRRSDADVLSLILARS